MGLTVSWIAIEGADKAAVFDHLRVVETDERTVVGEGRVMCAAVQPNGWLVIYHPDHDWADQDRVIALSQFGRTVGCQFSDHVGFAETQCAVGGRVLWRVSQEETVKTEGDLPPEWKLVGRLDPDEEEAPQALAQAICGFSVYESELEFALLIGSRAPARKRPDLMATLFGGLFKKGA